MSEFISTIDVLGDDAVVDSIIQRTITEFKDAQITELGRYAFYGCTALTTVELPNVRAIGRYAFAQSGIKRAYFPNLTELDVYGFDSSNQLTHVILPNVTRLSGSEFYRLGALMLADFSKLSEIGGASFQASSHLRTLIIRSETICVLKHAYSFGTAGNWDDTPIASGTGYIYVPKELIEDYKVATNWSTYADQFRALEDYTVDGTITGELDETKI